MRLVGSGRVGGGRPAIRLHGPPAVVRRLKELPEWLGEAGRLLSHAAKHLELLVGAAHGAAADDRGLPQRRERRAALLGEARKPGQEGVELTRRATQVAQHRALRGRELSQAQHVGIELTEELRQAVERAGELRPAGGGDGGRAARLAYEARHVSPAVRQRAHDRVAVGHDPLDGPRLACQHAQGLAGLAQTGMRPSQHGAQVVGSPCQTRAELSHDDPEPLCVRPAEYVVDQVQRDRGAGLLHGHGAAIGQPLARGPGLALHEVLADERLGPDLTVGVAAQVREPGLRDLHLHAGERPGTLLDLEVLGRPGADPGDLEVPARGHAERIVEQNGVGLALGVTVVRRAEREHRPEGRERHHRNRGCPLHGPTDLCDSSHPSMARSPPESTLEPSAAGSSFAPGQRRNCRSFGPGP